MVQETLKKENQLCPSVFNDIYTQGFITSKNISKPVWGTPSCFCTILKLQVCLLLLLPFECYGRRNPKKCFGKVLLSEVRMKTAQERILYVLLHYDKNVFMYFFGCCHKKITSYWGGLLNKAAPCMKNFNMESVVP